MWPRRRRASPESFENPQNPTWTTCQELTKVAEWHELRALPDKAKILAPYMIREVTWARYPNRYVLSDFGRAAKGQESPQSKAFVLRRLSSMRRDTGLHEYVCYTLGDQGLHNVIRSELKLPDEMTPEDAQDMRSSLDFTIDNKLYAPNAEDELEFEHIIAEAYQDGVSPYNGKG